MHCVALAGDQARVVFTRYLCWDALKFHGKQSLFIGFPVDVSEDPGRFLCNYIFYRSLRNCTNVGGSGNHALFIHVPPTEIIPLEDQVLKWPPNHLTIV
jgi:hypothetical protein